MTSRQYFVIKSKKGSDRPNFSLSAPTDAFQTHLEQAQLSYSAPHVKPIKESGHGAMKYHRVIALNVQEIGPDCNQPRGSPEASSPK